MTSTASSVTVPGPLSLLTDDEVAFRDAVAAFAAGEIAPRVREMERAGRIAADLIPKYTELGLLGIQIPEAYGGAGGSVMMVTIAVEELSKVDPAAAILVDVQNTLVQYPLLAYGTEAQKQQYLTATVNGMIGAYALSEAGSGSDAFALETRAVKDGDDWLLTGRKLWITNGAEAGVYIVFATVDPAKGYKGITSFIVERSFPGFAVGKKEDKLGIRASSTCELLLDQVRVPAANVLGPVGQGYKVAIETL
ncbi:MAG: acyl-CoA dehydrogenase family protein, partial [Gemmatimonadetes bacterium]|nr:acyl-CoA dehydrogenase family protein [Gemmatimonadota bacterium]